MVDYSSNKNESDKIENNDLVLDRSEVSLILAPTVPILSTSYVIYSTALLMRLQFHRVQEVFSHTKQDTQQIIQKIKNPSPPLTY